MKIAIIGSRNYHNIKAVYETMYHYFGCTFISGGALGIDTEAKNICKKYNQEFLEYKPDMSNGYDVKQYHLRNDRIIKESDKVIAFWDGKSKGTESVILKCLQRHKDIEVIFDK